MAGLEVVDFAFHCRDEELDDGSAVLCFFADDVCDVGAIGVAARLVLWRIGIDLIFLRPVCVRSER